MEGKWPLGLIVPIQDPTPFSAFHPQQWREALVLTAQHGYSMVELAITNPSYVDADSVGEALARAGLRLSSVTTGQAAGKEGLSLSSRDERVRRCAVDRIQAHMRWATRFEAVVIVGLLRGVDGDLHLLVESLKECAHVDRSVRLALEPLNRYETRLVNTVAEGLAVVERVGAENLGLLVDTFHANIEEARIGDALRAAGDRLFHVHLADSNRWPPGHGHLDFREVWEALSAVAYKGSIVLECLPKPSAQALLAAQAQIRSGWGKER